MKDREQPAESAVAVSELSDREISIELMKLMGEEVIDYHGPWRHLGPQSVPWTPFYQHYFDNTAEELEHETNVRPYATSLDAISEVEARLREAGWHIESHVLSAQAARFNGYVCDVHMTRPGADLPLVYAQTTARAHAEAYLAALQVAALNSPTPTAKGDA